MAKAKKTKNNRKIRNHENPAFMNPEFILSERAISDSELSRANLVLGDIASALSVGMPDKGAFNEYRSILDTQNTILKSADEIRRTVIVPTIKRLESATDRINSILSPVSGAIVDLGLGMANASRLYEDGLLRKKSFLDLQKFSSVSFNAIKEQQGILSSSIGMVKENFKNLVFPGASSISMIATGLDVASRAIPTFPQETKFRALEFVREETLLDPEEISEAQKMLDEMLEKLGYSELVEIRRGCWETFRRKNKDYIRQSSSSMRGLVDTFLRKIAPKEKVAGTEYFKDFEAKTKDKKPTRKAKIYYIVNYDSKKALHLKRMANELDEVYQNIVAWDHEPLKNDRFVYGSFIAIEGCMIQILSEIREDI